MTQLPPLVITGNRIDVLGPLDISGAVLHSFCIPADRAKLQALLDKTFTAPSGGAVRYEAIGSTVFLSFAEIGKCVATDPIEKDEGYSSEIDVTIWVMARRLDGELLALRWIPVYLFVDSAPAMTSGREVWGFPKQGGRFDFSPAAPDPGAARRFTVDGWVLDPFAPTSKARWAPIFEVEPKPEPPRDEGVLSSLAALADRAVGRLSQEMMQIATTLRSTLSAGAVTMAFLKQFPDAADPMRACYQAVIEGQSHVLQFRGAGLTANDYRVRVSSYASLPFLTELGVTSDWQDVGKGIWVDFDFRLELGSEVWRAP